MKTLKYIILFLIFLNVPSFGLYAFGTVFGSLSTVLLYACGLIYFFISPKEKIMFPFIFLGLSYFLISGINYSGELNTYFTDVIKYFTYIFFTVHLTRNTTQTELYFFLLLGAISIIVNVLLFPDDFYGRYSGLYLNPNIAAVVCLLGFLFSYCIKSTKYRLLVQFIFTVAGILTFSRSFIINLIIINLISMLANKKNFIGLLVGSIAMIIILNSTSLHLNAERFSAFKSVFSDDVDAEHITKNPRNETWALYTDVILDKPIIGNGYKSMQGGYVQPLGIWVGIHNSYLMTLGEAGVIPFLMLIFLSVSLFTRSIKYFQTNPEYLYLAITLFIYLLVSHNLFDSYMILFVSLWLYIRVKENPEINSLNEV